MRAKARGAERGRYQFEATASDDEVEDEIDSNLDEMSSVVGRLKALATTAGHVLACSTSPAEPSLTSTLPTQTRSRLSEFQARQARWQGRCPRQQRCQEYSASRSRQVIARGPQSALVAASPSSLNRSTSTPSPHVATSTSTLSV